MGFDVKPRPNFPGTYSIICKGCGWTAEGWTPTNSASTTTIQTDQYHTLEQHLSCERQRDTSALQEK